MNKIKLLLILFITFTFSLPAVAQESKHPKLKDWLNQRQQRKQKKHRQQRDVKNFKLSFDGYERSYLVQVPSTYSQKRKYPVLIGLHGGGGRGRNFIRSEPIFSQGINQHQYIGIYPDGVENQFNDGRTISDSKAHSENIDDVGFILKVIDQVAMKYSIDEDQIYVTGLSNGGHMSYRMACEASDRIAGIAVTAAQLSRNLSHSCRPKRAIPVVLFLGNEDPRVPFKGGVIGGRKAKRDEVISAEKTVDFWVRKNRCSNNPKKERLKDVDRSDGSRVVRYTYSQCLSQAGVVFYLIDGGGHSWPGGRQYFSQRMIGRVNMDINAVDEMWNIFKSY